MGVEDDPGAGPILLRRAREAIAARFTVSARASTSSLAEPCSIAEPDDAPSWLADPGATFVTLTKAGQLRGCIGTIEPYRSIADDVASNARAAAFRDPRFTPLTAAELPNVRIEVSVLSAPERIPSATEQEVLAAAQPGKDGLILSWRGHHGVFLPQVWEKLPEPREFFDQLKRKAGLPTSFWSTDARVDRFTVTAWREPDDRAP